jgi:hypothetical protein
MALKVETRGLTTTESLTSKPTQCFTCKQRKTGVFDTDPNGDPRCPDCQPQPKVAEAPNEA